MAAQSSDERLRVLIAGAGPVGLTAAELARRGIACRIVDPLLEAPQYAKAVGVQPRTLEIFEGMGVLRRILDASVPIRGQIVRINGESVSQPIPPLPADVPFGFIAIPQYETERVLADELAMHGLHIERGLRLTAFEQDADGVTVTLSGDAGDSRLRCRYLIGADGAHSMVRKCLGLSFEGGAFDEQYMLGDVELDWSLPHDQALRAMHRSEGRTDDVLVCVPLPGRGRYRMSMRVADDLATPRGDAADGVVHGFEGSRKPELHHIQAVLDRLSPEPVTARNLRWSSVFRISHRIVDAYGRGRVFVAGDTAHIHPPTGAQGMNTGIQDAHILAWKLALAVRGEARRRPACWPAGQLRRGTPPGRRRGGRPYGAKRSGRHRRGLEGPGLRRAARGAAADLLCRQPDRCRWRGPQRQPAGRQPRARRGRADARVRGSAAAPVFAARPPRTCGAALCRRGAVGRCGGRARSHGTSAA